MSFVRTVPLLAIWCCLASAAWGGDASGNWPSWRGPSMNGVSATATPPTRWSDTENILWRVPLPGPAGSTPVVYNGRIFLTSQDGEYLSLLCVSDRGTILWKRELDRGIETFRRDEGNLASPSPSVDGEHVWAFVGTGKLACFDHDGRPRWSFNVQDRYGEFNIQFGMASSPVLHEGRLYMQLIHGDGDPATQEARVVCLDAATGKEVWQRHRITVAHDECEHSYASPVICPQGDGPPCLVTHGADCAIAYALGDGRELWRCGGMNPPGNYNTALRFVASPAVGPGLVVLPTAKNGPVLGVDPRVRGDVVEANGLLWRYPDKTPDVPSPLVYDGLVYLCRENGNLLCLDASTGEEVYHERTERDRHRASPVVAAGRVYLTSRSGVVSVVRTGRRFQLLAQNDVGEPIASSPVVVGDTLYLRTFESLIAVRENGSSQ